MTKTANMGFLSLDGEPTKQTSSKLPVAPITRNRVLISTGTITTGRQIAAARALAGLSQKQLAQAAGLHPKTLTHWEAREEKWGMAGFAIDRIVDAFTARGIQFLEGEGPGVRLIR